MPRTPRDTVSVVIPTFNRASLLPLTLRSVLAQTYPATEVIIVDDGSTDDTASVCVDLPATVRYIRQDNTGLPGARNTGIRAATGAWIALCDSDDLWHPRKLELQLAALRATPEARWCLTGCSLIDPEGKSVETQHSGLQHVFPAFNHRGLPPDEYFARWLQARTVEADDHRNVIYAGDAFAMLFDGNIALPSSALVARSLMDEAGLFDESFRWAEDTEFFHRMAAASPVAIMLDPLVLYRVGHPAMISSGVGTLRLIQNALTSLERASQLRQPLSKAETEAYARGRYRMLLHLAYARLTALDRSGAREAIRESWAMNHKMNGKLLGVFLASALPVPLLRGLQRAKRMFRT